jgi:hypothetical protein
MPTESESAEILVEQIDQVMKDDATISQKTRDRLIMLSLRVLLTNSSRNSSRLDELEKYRPYLQAAVWLAGVLVAGVLAAIIAGKIQLTYIP